MKITGDNHILRDQIIEFFLQLAFLNKQLGIKINIFN